MTLLRLKQIIDSTISGLREYEDPDKIPVLLTISSIHPVIGSEPSCGIRWAGMGFDWEHGQFRLYPSVPLVENKW